MKAAVTFTLLAGSYATDCSPGYKHKKVLTNLKCKSSAGTAKLQGADNCNTNCCDADLKTCGGLAVSGGITCTGSKYQGGASGTQASKDAWAAIATTAANAATDCCVTKSKCGSASYTCPAGQKKKTSNANTDCTSDDKSCIKTAACCEAATDQCKTWAGTCPTDYLKGEDLCLGDAACKEAWGSTKYTVGQEQATCCVVEPTCFGMKASVDCGAGKKFKTTITAAAPEAISPYTAANIKTKCCVADADVCAGATVTCASGSFRSTALGSRSVKGASATQINAACCAPTAKCSNYACPKGYKAKTSAAKTACTGDVATCTTAACCDADKTTCGGNYPTVALLTCAAGSYDERTFFKNADDKDLGIKKTTQAAKDAWALKVGNSSKLCCTPVANCTNITSAAAAGVTTTPAPVVTTTPAAAPALKFSEHKVAIERSTGSNMVWLGVGGVLGMGVLMVVQHVRSQRYAPVRDVSLE